MTQLNLRLSALGVAAAALTSCDTATKKNPTCGPVRTVAVSPVGGSDSIREVNLMPVCKREP